MNPVDLKVIENLKEMGIAHLAMAVLGPGDGVLVPNPSYPVHTYGAVIADADVRHVPLTPDVDFFSELETAITNSWPKPKLLIVNFPGNPTIPACLHHQAWRC